MRVGINRDLAADVKPGPDLCGDLHCSRVETIDNCMWQAGRFVAASLEYHHDSHILIVVSDAHPHAIPP
jgi:hypothetical protein